MAKKNAKDFEQQMARLQVIVQELERADLPLEKNVELFKEGRTLVMACRELLEKARNEVAVFTANGLEDFVPRMVDDGFADNDDITF